METVTPNRITGMIVVGDYMIVESNRFHIVPAINWIEHKDIIEHYPSEILSKVLGIKLYKEWGINDISNLRKKFNIPELIYLFDNHKELETISNSGSYKSYLQNVKEASEKLNREVNIQSKHELLCKDIWLGCLSKFNFDDIKYYCETGYEERFTKEKQEELEIRMNFDFSYVPSMETLIKIEKQLDKTNFRATKENLIEIVTKW